MPTKQKPLKDLCDKLKDRPPLSLREYLLDEGKNKDIVDALMSADRDDRDEGGPNQCQNDIFLDDVHENNFFLAGNEQQI